MSTERTYSISFQKVKERSPRTKRAEKAIRYVKAFLKKHMKSDEITLESSLNEKLWERGMRKLPARLKVKAVKQEDGKVIAALAE